MKTPHLIAMVFLFGFGRLTGPAAPQTGSAYEGVSSAETFSPLTTDAPTVSDSPHLRVPDEMKNWPPAQPPARPLLVPAAPQEQAAVEYDLQTRRALQLPVAKITENKSPAPALSFEGLLPPGMSPANVLGADDRVRVGDTTAFPWRTICKLFITASDGTYWSGSGAIIGRADGNGFHVLTAGHVVYMHDHGGWVSSIEVIPAYDDGYMPLHRAYATYFRTYTGWTSSASPEHNWAVVTLDRRVGNFTGWMGRITASSSDSIYTSTLNSAGYPGDLCSGNCMYFDSDSGSAADEYRHWYFMDTSGQGGMPVWLYIAGDRYITTVHAYGDDGTGRNSGTRLNLDKFDRIVSWIDSDALPSDRPDLIDDGPAYSSFTPTSVTAGTSSLSLQCRVRNVGTASSGNFRVNFYASANTIISSFDYLIGQTTVDSISPFSYGAASWSGLVPGGIPAGTYYVGWIVDEENIVAEFDDDNNSAYKPFPQLTVADAGPPDIRVAPLTLSFTGTTATAGELSEHQTAENRPAAGGKVVTTEAAAEKMIDSLELMQGFVNAAKVKVVVNLAQPPAAQAAVNFHSQVALRAWQSTVFNLQKDALVNLPADQVSVRFRYQNIPAFSAEVTWEGLQALLADPRVASVEPVYILESHLAQGISLIHAETYRSTYDGSGIAIAICDTGVDYRHPRLGGGGFPNSKVLGGYDFGDGDSDPAPDGEAHGTACAGIAAGELGTVGDYIGGVAPGAKLYALKISYGSAGFATSDAMAAAWDWCVTHKNDDPAHPILVISTSFGGGRHFTDCDTDVPSMTMAANNAAAAGITVLASSGNNGFCDSLAWPACISSVISVGAVYDEAFGPYYPCVDAASCAPKIATGGCQSGYYVDDSTSPDKITAYSNTASFLGVLAPGNRCYTLDISSASGYTAGDYFDSFGGTSAACPYVAGAVAALQTAAKTLTGSYLTAQEVRSRLISTGDNITDTKVGTTKPRVNLERAIQSLPAAGQPFRIYNDGNATLTVTSIVSENPAPWLSVTPAGSFTVAAGEFRDVNVAVNLALAPAGQTITRLLVTSNDLDENPYPGGVQVVVTRSACTFSLTPTSRAHGSGPDVDCLNVGASSGCAWTVLSDAPWLTVTSNSSGSGSDSVCYFVAVNPSPSPRSATLTIAGQSFAVMQAGAPMTPPNDHFANGFAINSGAATLFGNNELATKEPGEPNHVGDGGGKSVWWTWTAPGTGTAVIDTLGSSFDTLLAIYSGNSLSGLISIAENNDAASDHTSAVSFSTVAGRVYHIAVDGYRGGAGSIQLSLRGIIQPPLNDMFADRIKVPDESASLTGHNEATTKEVGEPDHAGNVGGKSVWWTWKALKTATMQLNTKGSSFDTVLAVYTGSAVSQLTLMSSDDDSGGGLNSALIFQATAGTTYQIAVDGYNGAWGQVALNLNPLAMLRILPPQYVANGFCRLWIGWADGTPIDPGQIPTVAVYASSDLAVPPAAWRRLSGSLSLSNGLLWIDDTGTGALPAQFYFVKENP